MLVATRAASAGRRMKQLFMKTRTEERGAWSPVASAGLRPMQLFVKTRTEERVASPS